MKVTLKYPIEALNSDAERPCKDFAEHLMSDIADVISSCLPEPSWLDGIRVIGIEQKDEVESIKIEMHGPDSYRTWQNRMVAIMAFLDGMEIVPGQWRLACYWPDELTKRTESISDVPMLTFKCEDGETF